MTLPVEVSGEAISDLTALAASYEDRSPGLSERFLAAFLERLRQGASFPLSGPTYHRDIRKFMLRPFQVLLLYRVTAEAVEIVALVDARRSPGVVKSILDNR